MSDNSPDTVGPGVSRPAPVRDSSRARAPLLAFVADDASEVALRGGLLSLVDSIEIHRGTILHAIRHLTREPTPRALIVDISGVENPLSELDNLARICTPDVRVLVIGEENTVGFYREMVRNMGVAEYLYKPLTRDGVSRLFVPQIAGATLDAGVSRTGTVIAVCGARGGVGATTVAVNLALQLTSATRGHVALLDLHLQQGTAALMLGVRPVGGLRIALEQPERADALFLDRVLVEISERFRLVAADEPLDAMLSPTPDGMRCVLDLLRHRFNYVIIDMPTSQTLAERLAFRAARHLLVVMAPDLAGIRDADRLRQMAAGFGTIQTSIVLNRVGMQGSLTMPMIEQGLGVLPTIQIPELGKQLGRAANLGKPAVGDCAAFTRPMAMLAQEVSGAPVQAGLRASGRSLFDRMIGR